MATTIQSGRSSSPLLTADVASRAEVYGGRGLVFDGSTDYLTISEDALAGKSQGTISFWTKTSGTGNQAILGYHRDQWSIRFNKTTMFLGIGGTTVTASSSLDNSAWGFHTITFNSGTAKFYKDGELYHTATSYGSSFPSNSNGIFIGKRNHPSAYYYNGSISDVKVHSSALTEAEITSQYLKPESVPSPSTLVAWYPMSEANPESPQSIVYDHSEKRLGSENVVNATDWTDSNSDGLADNWADNYAGKLDYSVVTGNGFTGNAQRFEVNDVAGSDRAIRTTGNYVFTSGTLYKVSFKYRASISSGSILVMDGGSGATVTNITTHTGDAKLFETYYVAPTGSHLWFYMQNADANAFMEIDDVSVKEVLMGNHATTNFFGNMKDVLSSAQILAMDSILTANSGTYEFDFSDTAGNQVTQSTLGSELYGDASFTNASYATIVGDGVGETLDVNTTNSGKLTAIAAQDCTLTKSGILVSGKLYKLVIIIDSYTDGRIRGNAGASSMPQIYNEGTGTFTRYFIATSTQFSLNIDINADFTATDLSVKEITTTKFFPLFGSDEINGNTLKLTNDGTTKAHVALPFTTVVGKSYNAEVKLTTANMSGGLSVSDDLNENTLSVSSSSGAIIPSNTFVATGTTSYLHIKNNSTNSGQHNLYDDLKVREVGISSFGFTTAQNEPVIPQIPLVKYNEKMFFNKISSKVTTSNISTSATSTYSFWINLNSISGTQDLFTHANIYFRAIDNDLYVYSDFPNHTRYDNILTIGDSMHLVWVANSGTHTLYKNGVALTPNATTSSAIAVATNVINISSSGNVISGIVDEFSFWNTALTGAEVQELFADSVIKNATTHSKSGNLLGYWRNDGVTTWTDRRGWSYLNFDGVNDFIQLPVPFSYTNHSISVWVNHSGINDVLFSAQKNGSEGIRLFIDDGNRLIYKVNGSDALVATAYANQWVHFVCTYDGSTMRVYANGVEVKTISVSGLSVDTSTNARIGATSFENGSYFEGSISSVGLYNVTKSASEVLEIYNNGIGGSESSNSGLTGYWKLDNVTTVTDLSSNSNNGTVTGATLNTGNTGTVAGTPDLITIREGLNSNKDGLGFPLTNPSSNVLRLNGSSEIAIIPKTSGLDMSGGKPFTMSCWFKAKVVGVNHVLISSGDAGTAHYENSFYVSSSNKLAWNNQDSDADFANSSGTTLAINTWYFATITFNGSTTVKIYLNDALDGTKSDCTNVTIAYTDVYIGKRSNGLFFNGLIDEARIYNRELLLPEIQKNYKHQKGKHK